MAKFNKEIQQMANTRAEINTRHLRDTQRNILNRDVREQFLLNLCINIGEGEDWKIPYTSGIPRIFMITTVRLIILISIFNRLVLLTIIMIKLQISTVYYHLARSIYIHKSHSFLTHQGYISITTTLFVYKITCRKLARQMCY